MSILINKHLIRLGLAGMIAVLLLLMGCQEEEPEISTTITAETIPVPTLRLGVPGSMTYGTASASINANQDGYNAAVITDVDENGCPTLKEGEDIFENGYAMSKFLVVLSENQACYADAFMLATSLFLGNFINNGKIATEDTTGLTHFQLDLTGTTYELWFWFDSAASPTFYMTWTGSSSTDSTGYFINTQLTDATADLSAVRFEFVRDGTSAVNEIFVEYSGDASEDFDGFHSMVTKTTSGSVISYLAKGILRFQSQFGTNIPTEVTATPKLRMVTVSDSNGLGAAKADFTDVAIRFESAGTWDLGAYLFTLGDKVYFDTDGVPQWQMKEVTTGTYAVSTTRTGGTDLTDIIGCLEETTCPEINLPAGYFAGTCVDTDNVAGNCTEFIQAIYDTGWSGDHVNSDSSEDTTDSRYPLLNNAVHLPLTWTASYIIPAP